MNTHEAARICLWLTLVVGLLYAAVYPPFAPRHELEHLAAAYGLAHGQLTPRIDGEGPAHWLPLPPSDALDAYRLLPLDENARLDLAAWWRDLSAPRPATDTRIAAAPSTTSLLPLVAHVPALWLAQLCGLAPLLQLYLARLFGIVSYAVLVAGAVALAGPLHLVFFALALMPSALADAGSVTGASLPYALSLLLAALCLGRVRATEALVPAHRARLAALLALGVALAALGWGLDARPLVPAPDTLGARLSWPFTHPIAALNMLRLTVFRRGDEALLQLLACEGWLAHQLRFGGAVISVVLGQLLLGLSCGTLYGSLPAARARLLARRFLLVALLLGVAVCTSLYLAQEGLAHTTLQGFDGAPFRPLLPWLALALALGTRPVAARWLARSPFTRVVLPILLLHAYALFALFGRFHVASLPFPA